MISQVADPLVRKNISQIFEREANILATLRHPAIPRIYDFFTIGERSYLVMEYINGKDLDDVLAETSTFFPEETVLGWAIELCDVLHYLHSHKPEPIVFRDIKPSNIMISNQNQIVLVDFGIAKVFQSGQKNTMVGTQGYSPPDQYRGEATPKVDIYALGATMHHLLTMRDPRLEAPFSFNERPIKEINPGVSDEVIAIIDRSIEYDPEDRFESADEMKEALLNAGRKTGKLTGAIFSTAAIPSQVKSGVKPLWTFECEDEIRGAPLCHQGILYIGCTDHNLYSLDASNGEFKWKYASDGPITGRPVLFENSLFFGSDDHRLHAVSTRSGSILWTYFTDAPIRSSPRIAEGHIFIGSDDGLLHAVNVNTGRHSWRVDAGAAIRSTPFVSNEYVYFGTEIGNILCVNFRGETKWTFSAKRSVTSSPIVYDGALYAGSLDSILYALDATSGWVIWRFRLGKGTLSSPRISDNDLFIGAADNVIYCIDIRTSKEVWRYITEHQIVGSPVVYKDAIYCGSADAHMYCLESKTGRVRWKFSTGGPILGTPVVNDDIVYFGSTDKLIYALLA
jgi:outer membrane protein assembly factor BamB